MGTPPMVRTLRDAQFQRARFMCTGEQLAELLTTCSNAAPGLLWWAADVQVTGAMDLWSPYRPQAPRLLGGVDQLLSKLRAVDQLQSGVFLGQRPSRQAPPIRDGGFWTEDDDPVESGGVQVEVRAFDTSYFLLYCWDETILAALDVRFFSGRQP
ncbi:hypothetical protein L6R49_24830 [Myxococcota bacterium]|nr:hypothetical protein [Myxococcota bacterium]